MQQFFQTARLEAPAYLISCGWTSWKGTVLTVRSLVTDRRLRGDEPMESGTLDRCDFDCHSSSSTLTRTGTPTSPTLELINVLKEVINIHLV